jgi:ABC-type uncharacterized transport system involved in gliding motility auxiliary subunit
MSEIKAHPIKQISGGLVGLLVLLAALIAGNIIIKNLHLRADLTDEKRFSLSDGTINTIKKLEDNVEMQFYFSKSNPKVPMQLKTFAEKTEDFLREYARNSNGKIKLTVIDPKPDTDAEDQAAQNGLQGLPLDMYGAPLYMGLVLTSGKYSATIPIIDPQKERFLEYEVSRMIYQITHPQKPVIGVLSSLPVLGSEPSRFAMPGQPQPPPQKPWFVFSDLKKDFDLRDIDPLSAEEGIPDEIKTLVVVHPKDFSDKAYYAIDQFVMRGGHLIAFVDPSAYSDNTAAPNPYGMPPSASSDMAKLFAAWGIKYDPARIIVDRETGMQVREGNRAVLNHAILNYNAKNVNKEDAASANLTSLRAIFAGALVDNSDESVTVVPLLTTSANSGTSPAATARFGSEAMQRDYRAAGAPQNLAVKLTGKFKTAFPDGRPKTEEDDKDKAKDDKVADNDTTLKEGESTIVVIADVDMLADITNVEDVRTPFGNMRQQVSNNGTLLANLVDQLAGDQDLISIRSRAEVDRRFTKVEELRKKAQLKFEDKMTELNKQLQDAEQRINELQQQKDASQRNFISDEQRSEIKKFHARKREISHEIRQVQKDLRKDIDKLGTKIKLANIALMPLLVIAMGIVVAVRKHKR